MTNISAHAHQFRAKRTALLIFLCSSYAWADVVLDGTMGTTTTINGPVFEITEGMGQTRGNNLFHSFQTFDLISNETAIFSGSASVQNIVGRITGGTQSSIDGTITSTINGANVFLLNPNGILFGANAIIDISGSFHASTADSLRFTDDLVFYADPSSDPILSSASPAAFGFLTNTPAPIKVEGLNNLRGTDVSLVGGDITIANDTNPDSFVSYVYNNDGQINLTSVASQGDVNFENDEHQLIGFTDLGTISIFNSEIYTDGDSGGRIVIRGGKLDIDYALIIADTLGAGNTYKTTGIDIDIVGDVTINASEIYAYAYDGSTGNGNDIKIKSETLTLDNGTIINTGVDPDVTGSSGDIIIESNKTKILNGSGIQTNTSGFGNSGDIVFNNTDTLLLDTSSYLYTQSDQSAVGDGGDIIIRNNKTDILNGSTLQANSDSSGNAGNIRITTGDLKISNKNSIDFSTSNSAAIYSFNKSGNSSSGNVFINANNVTLDNFGVIRTVNSGVAGGGKINIDAKQSVNINNGARILTDTFNIKKSNAGDINIKANSINVIGSIESENSNITSSVSNNLGKSGTVSLNTDLLNIKNGAIIQTYSQFGANGDINISALDIVISGYNKFEYDRLLPNNKASSSDLLKSVSSKLSSTTVVTETTLPAFGKLEQSGNINVNANNLTMSKGGSIYTDTASGFANAGNIELNIENINISTGSKISSSSVPRGIINNGIPGDAGTITIQSNNVSVDGSSFLNVSSGILSESSNKGGQAADISIHTSNLNLSNGALISSSSKNQSNSGNINLSISNQLSLQNSARISTSALNSGKAGNINIDKANSLVLSNNSLISSTANQADGGNININTTSKVYLSDSKINTDVASSRGNGGDVTIRTNYLVLEGSKITTTAIAGNGGDITITTNSILKTADSDINADSEESISGNIDINTLVDGNAVLAPITEKRLSISTIFADSCTNNIDNNSRLIVKTSVPNKWENKAYTSVMENKLNTHKATEIKNRTMASITNSGRASTKCR